MAALTPGKAVAMTLTASNLSVVPAGPPKLGGTLLMFEHTDPATLAYHPDKHK
jgi:hypothetical protein